MASFDQKLRTLYLMEILLERTDDEHMLAFIVKTKEGTIYHAGDLNDWYWDGEPKADNQRLTSAYHVEIRKIKGMHFDAAFVPLDPRQGDHYADGILYFLKNIDCNVIFPNFFLILSIASCIRFSRSSAASSSSCFFLCAS